MKLKEIAILQEKKIIDENLPDNYPKFDVPATVDTLYHLYDEFNKLYFGNELKRIPINIKSLQGKFGVTSVVYYDKKIKSMSISLTKKIMPYRKSVVNTLLHEMIHAWQYTKFDETGDMSYIDKFITSTEHTKGHGHWFFILLNKLNAAGFEISVTADHGEMIDINDQYLIILTLVSNHKVLIRSNENPEKNINEIVLQAAEKLGHGQIKSYSIIKSDDSDIMQIVQLTKAGKIKSNSILLAYKDTFVSKLISGGTLIIKDTDVDSTGRAKGIPPDIIKNTKAARKNFRAKSFAVYIHTILKYSTDYHSAAAKLVDNPESVTELPKDILKYVYDDWKNVTLPEIKSSSWMSNITTTIGNYLIGRTDIKTVDKVLTDAYATFIENRMTREDFVDIVVSKFSSDEAREIKKYPSLAGSYGSGNKADIENFIRKKLFSNSSFV